MWASCQSVNAHQSPRLADQKRTVLPHLIRMVLSSDPARACDCHRRLLPSASTQPSALTKLLHIVRTKQAALRYFKIQFTPHLLFHGLQQGGHARHQGEEHLRSVCRAQGSDVMLPPTKAAALLNGDTQSPTAQSTVSHAHRLQPGARDGVLCTLKPLLERRRLHSGRVTAQLNSSSTSVLMIRQRHLDDQTSMTAAQRLCRHSETGEAHRWQQ